MFTKKCPRNPYNNDLLPHSYLTHHRYNMYVMLNPWKTKTQFEIIEVWKKKKHLSNLHSDPYKKKINVYYIIVKYQLNSN